MSKTEKYNVYVSVKKTNVETLCFASKELKEFCLKFGVGAENKEIPNFIIDLPKERLKIFLEGYMDGDGCKTNKNVFKATSVSKKLILKEKLFYKRK